MTQQTRYLAHIVSPSNYFCDYLEQRYKDSYIFINLYRLTDAGRERRLAEAAAATADDARRTIILGPGPKDNKGAATISASWLLYDDVSEINYINERLDEDSRRFFTFYTTSAEVSRVINGEINVSLTRKHYSTLYNKMAERYKTYKATRRDEIERILATRAAAAEAATATAAETPAADSKDLPKIIHLDKKHSKTIRVFAHITGTPGAGKTFLGNLLKDRYLVKDIDDFMSSSVLKISSAHDHELYVSQDKRQRVYRRIINRIYNWVEQTRKTTTLPIVLVGISYIYTSDEIFMIPIEAQWRYIIDIPLDTLFTQYVRRDLEYMCAFKEDTLAEIEASGYTGRWDRDRLAKTHAITSMLYKNERYILLPQAEIEREMDEIKGIVGLLSFDHFAGFS